VPRKRIGGLQTGFVAANRLTGAAANRIAGNGEQSERGLKSCSRLGAVDSEPLLIDGLVGSMRSNPRGAVAVVGGVRKIRCGRSLDTSGREKEGK
jgi:hypothetical protein